MQSPFLPRREETNDWMTYWKLQRKCITHTVDHPLVDKGDVVEEVEGGGGRPSSMRERCFNGTTFTNQYFECIRSSFIDPTLVHFVRAIKFCDRFAKKN